MHNVYNSGYVESRVGGWFDVRDTSCLKDTKMLCYRAPTQVQAQLNSLKYCGHLFSYTETRYHDKILYVYLYWSPAASPFFSSSFCPVGEKKQNPPNELLILSGMASIDYFWIPLCFPG